jgi:hypothetical protein
MGNRFKPDDPYFIYGLVDQRTDKVRYVGRTYDIQKRKKDHVYEATHPNTSMAPESYKNKWIRKIIKNKLNIEIILLEETTYEKSDEREQFWIAFYERKNLTNKTDGGLKKEYFQNNDMLDIKKLKNNITRIRSILKHKWIKDQKQAFSNYARIMFDLSEYKNNYDLAIQDKNFIENTFMEPSEYTIRYFNLSDEKISIKKYLELIESTFDTWKKCTPKECFYDYIALRFGEGDTSILFERVFGENCFD